MAQTTVETAQMNYLVPAWQKPVDRQSLAVQIAFISVCRAPGAVTEKLTVIMEPMSRAVLQSSAQTPSSAVGTANACPPPLCAMTMQTVTMPVMRPPAHQSPAVQHPSSATILFAFHACGPAMVMPTAPMARTSGPRTVVHRDLALLPLISAHLWSSTVAVGSASMVAGSVMEELTALIDQMKLTVLVQLVVLMSLSAVMGLASMVAASATTCTTVGT